MKLDQNTNRVKTPFGDFQIDVDNLVDHFFGDSSKSPRPSGAEWTPRVSVTENQTEYQMVVELPGVAPEDVSVEIQEGRLEVSGEKKTHELEGGIELVRDERKSGAFQRTFEFSTLIDADRIKAVFKNGLLTLALPKSKKVLPRKIDISIAE